MDLPTTFFTQMVYLLVNNFPLFLEGIKNTLFISLTGTVIGAAIGCFLSIVRTMEINQYDKKVNKIAKKIAIRMVIIYVDVIRGTPMMVQAMIFFYGVAANYIDPIPTGIIIISFNTAAYITEIMRGSIEAIDKGQLEAARSLGLSRYVAMRKIVLPQAFKNSVPALMNELIVNVKDSSVLSVIGVTELFYMSKAAGSEYYWTLPAYVLGAICYLIMTITLAKSFEHYMKKRENKKVTFPTSQTIDVEV